MSAQQVGRVFGFSSSAMSWASYSKYRPPYPKSLYDMIFSYHRSHSGRFDFAHDVGSGAGIVAAELANHFRRLHVSDPSSHNFANAQKNLGQLDIKCEITFSQTPAEDKVLPDASVDMVTIFIALHWTDAERAISAAAASLKPGGTLALLHYSPRVFLPNNARAQAAWNEIMDAHSRNIYETPGDLGGGRRAHPQTDAGLDYFEMSHDVFERGVRRIYINTEGRGDKPFAKSARAMREGWFPVLQSRTRHDDVVERWQDEEDWGRKVDGDWFREYYQTIQPVADLSKLDKEFEELKRAIDDNGGEIQVLWSVEVVLATRK